MNVLIDSRLVINKTTGIGSYLSNLIESILNMDKENKYILLLKSKLFHGHKIRKIEDSNLLKKYVDIPEVSLSQHVRVPLALQKESFDIYHYPHFDLPIFQRYNSVVTIHDLKYIIAPEFFPDFGLAKKMYMDFFYKSSLRKAKEIIVVSESTRNDLISKFNADETKINVIPLASETKFSIFENKNEIKNKLKKIGINFKYFLFVGERRPHKNLVRVIEAFHIFKKRTSSKHKLIIIGKSYANYTLPEEKTVQLNIENDVIFAGFVPDDLLPIYYQGAEGLVFASLYEGFGIPILEAMSCGIPVITSKISSMPEVAGDAALLVNPESVDDIANNMERIYSDSTLKSELIKCGKIRAKKYSWEKTAEKTLAVYEKVYLNGAKKKS